MSEYDIPFPIQEEIMKRLPVKSLVKFRSVSKEWKSLIDNRQFIIDYGNYSHNRPHHVLVAHQVSKEKVNFSSYIDDDTFPRKVFFPTVPLLFKQLCCFRLIGSSHGLICVHGYYMVLDKPMAVIWNPSIRKSVAVPVYQHYPKLPVCGILGFGVCPATSDPKLLLVLDPLDFRDTCYGAAVYRLSSGKWTTLNPSMVGGKWCKTVTTKKFIYSYPMQDHKNIRAFDLTHETFGVIDLPHDVADVSYTSTIRESLALIRYRENVCTVWWLDDNGSFRYLYKINVVPDVDYILEFRKNRKPIMIWTNCDDPVYKLGVDEPVTLVDYDPISDHANVIPNSGLEYDVNVKSYMETILLQDCKSAITD